MQAKHSLELENIKDEAERKHRNKVEQLKMDIDDQHEKVNVTGITTVITLQLLCHFNGIALFLQIHC